MIRIECDNCEKTFEVEDEKAGGKAPCPHCDDVNRVPEVKAAAGGPLPDSDAPEETICTVRPAMFRARPFLYTFLVLLVVAGIVLAGGARLMEAIKPWLMWPGLVVTAFALGWFASWWIATHFWIKLTVTNKRSIRQEGIIKRHTTEVLHDHIRSVDIRQSLMHRLLNVGDLDIDSAGQAGDRDIEIEMNRIPRPYEVKKIIDQYRDM